MNEILLLGAGPVPSADSTMTCSYNLRTAKLAHWLRGEGIPFRLAAVDIFNTIHNTSETQPSLAGDYLLFSKDDRGRERLAAFIHELRPKAILATSYESAATVCAIDHSFPIWADMPGWIMSEAQLKSFNVHDDSFVEHFAARERAVLQRADVFSVVSQNQRHATLGELGILGRLSRRNIDHDLVRVLPSLAHDWQAHLMECGMRNGESPKCGMRNAECGMRNPEIPHSAFRIPHSNNPQSTIEQSAIPPDALVLLWSGSYNLWTDAGRIAAVITELLRAVPRLHFVSTGGYVPYHNDVIYHAFLDAIQAADCPERIHLLPWLPFGESLRWLDRADLGLCIDGINIEIAYGSRTRVVDMLAHGLPVATTPGTELVNDLAGAGAVIALDPAAPQRWAEAILPYLSAPEWLRELAAHGRRYIYEHYALRVVGRELLEWLREPRRAPDLLFRERVKAVRDSEAAPPTWAQYEQPLVTWEPQARIEACARRSLDPFAPSRNSLRAQKCLRALLSNQVIWGPVLAAWRLASRALPASSAARWQSRIDPWLAAWPHAPAAQRFIHDAGRGIFRRALLRTADPNHARAINILLARHEYDRQSDLACLPQRIEIEASSACNIRCRMCKIPYTHKPAVHMSREIFERIAPYLSTAATFEIIGEGEPTLNPGLPCFLETAAASGCHIRMFTNGTRLTPELSAAIVRARVGILVVSLCAARREAWQQVTGADLLDRVLENVHDLRDIRRLAGSPFPRLHMNCPLIADTLDEAPGLVRHAVSLGCERISFGMAMIFREEMETQSLLNVDPEKLRAVFTECEAIGREAGLPVITPPLGGANALAPFDNTPQNRFGCLYPWQSVRVGADGTVEACTYNRKILGNLREATLAEIWNGPEARRFRAGQARHNGINYCEICYHRGYRAREFNPQKLLPYEQYWHGYH